MPFPEKVLWYFADPMCSWCWGFSPVISQIVTDYRERISVSLVVGGLRVGQSEPLSNETRNEILHHWRDVARMTGQPFTFDGALPEGFVYDTEPACRAATAIPDLDKAATLPFFTAVQKAFYVEQRDVSRIEVLADVAVAQGLDEQQFVQAWRSDEVINKTRRQFAMTREFGVRGFPTGVLQDSRGYQLATSGFRTLAEMRSTLDAWLDAAEPHE